MKLKRKNALLLTLLIPVLAAAQTLDQQLRQAIDAGVLPPNIQNPIGPFEGIAPKAAPRDGAPKGISSAIGVSPLIEEVKMGSLSTFFPRGYGSEPLHFGIWNAIPFVVFNNDNMDLRFGLIFEHRQTGFVPDDWVNTTITGQGMPELSFLIPKTKTFLNFSRGTSQWRSTVLLTDSQIKALAEYTKDGAINPSDPNSQVYTITHRFIDSSTRLYLIGVRHKEFFKAVLKLYEDLALNKNVKTFKNSNTFPKNGFFDDLTLQEVTNQTSVVTTTVEEAPPAAPPAENAYPADETAAGAYDAAAYDDAAYNEAGYDDYYPEGQ